MGTKARSKVILLAALCLLVSPLRCHAASVSELYQLYGKEFEVEIPEDITKTISSYNGAKKYVSMYNYVVNSEFNKEQLKDERESVEARRLELEKLLLNGYDSSYAEILSVEDEYAECTKRIEEINMSLTSYEIEANPLDTSTVPTYSEYTDAMRERNDIVSTTQIGDISELSVPAQSSARLLENSDEYCSYRVVEGTGALSMFNGTVKDVIVDENFGLTVIIDNRNGVTSYVCNLELVDVQPGDTVYQNQRLGYVYGSKLILRLQLGDDFVDISKLLKEV